MIRPGRLDDLAALLALEATFPGDRLSRRSFRHLLTRGHADVLVYECEGKLGGDLVVLYRRGLTQARLYSLVVHPGSRGTGVGQALLARGEALALSRGCARMALEVRQDNAAAVALYTRAGYHTAHCIPGYYEDGAAALRMVKTLGLSSQGRQSTASQRG